SSAQDASFGIKAGLSTNTLALDVDSQVQADGGASYSIDASETQVGFHAGFTSRISFGGFFLMPELYFSSATNTYEVTTLVTSVRQEADQTLLKLDVPVLAGFKTGPFRVNAGPIATLILDEDNGLANLLLDGSTGNGDEGTKNFTFGFQAGIGLDISKLAIDIRYEGNLSKLSDGLTLGDNNFNFDTRQRQIILSVGVLF
ncbi:MAG: outer membrane beta-barrel protein, partial [Flammeovirgaceae bacterium]